MENVQTLVTLRESVAMEIHAHMDTIGSSFLIIGKALLDVREDFSTQQEFLGWVQGEFGLSKSSTFDFMKVYKTFGDNPRVKNVANRVLVTLSRYVNDDAVMNRALALADEGKLNNSSLASILDPTLQAKKVTATPVIPAEKPAEKEKLVNPEADAPDIQELSESITAALGDKNPPVAEEAVIAYEVVVPVEEPAPPIVENSEVEGLRALVETLKATIQALHDEYKNRDTARDAKVKAAPMLPQFKSKCLYARLGLSAEESQDVKAVKKAQRELVKLGYGEGHEAWAKISEAVTALTGA